MSRVTSERAGQPGDQPTTAEGIDREKLARLVADAALTDPEILHELRLLLGIADPPSPTSAGPDGKGGVDPQAQLGPTTNDSSDADDFYMVGSSPPMLNVFEQIRRCATSDAPVLIAGESGTGKELAARAIHERSARAQGPFVIINCAALPATLIASELFGYEKGAFTGATARKIGRLEAANRGTVFLDEIGDLPLDLQGHLLRFLQEKVIERVGGNKPIALDVRVIAASHVSLHDAVQRGVFRDDLFYRLHVLTLDMPPLRARGDDIMLLAMFTLRQIEQDTQGTEHRFDPSATAAIMTHDWPGNVRELIACIRRAVVFATGPLIQASDLGIVPSTTQRRTAEGPASTESHQPSSAGNGESHQDDRIREVLVRHGYNIRRAAMAYGVSRVTMYRLIQKFGIELARHRFGRAPAVSPPASTDKTDDA